MLCIAVTASTIFLGASTYLLYNYVSRLERTWEEIKPLMVVQPISQPASRPATPPTTLNYYLPEHIRHPVGDLKDKVEYKDNTRRSPDLLKH